MPEAARLSDPIGHSPTMNWLLAGLAIGAAIGVAGVLIVGTGGLAAAAIVGGLAAAGAGVGEVLSTMSWAPKEVVGVIVGLCSPNVFINGLAAARAHIDFAQCAKHPVPLPLLGQVIAQGSGNVFINGMPAARKGDKTSCSAEITRGSGNVFIGGGTQQTDTIQPENLVPDWVHWSLLGVGIGSAVVLGGPILAIGGLAGGIAGGMLGNWLGGKQFGEGSDGQKWSMLAGSFLGGFLGAKGAVKPANWVGEAVVAKGWVKTGVFIKGGLPGVQEFNGSRTTDPLKVRQAENAKLRNSDQFALDKEKVGVTDEQISLMDQKKVPLGFKDKTQFERFKTDMSDGLRKSGLEDAEVGLKGTSTTFYSENPGKPLRHHWDANPKAPGDYDLNITSKAMVEKMKSSEIIPSEKYGVYKTKDIEAAFPELSKFAKNWSEELGRDVNFVGYPKPSIRDATEFILKR